MRLSREIIRLFVLFSVLARGWMCRVCCFLIFVSAQTMTCHLGHDKRLIMLWPGVCDLGPAHVPGVADWWPPISQPCLPVYQLSRRGWASDRRRVTCTSCVCIWGPEQNRGCHKHGTWKLRLVLYTGISQSLTWWKLRHFNQSGS